jgi:glutamyl-tRNA synthetase
MPDGREIFSLDDFVESFTFERVATTGPIFDLARLDALNGHYIRALSPDELFDRLQPYLPPEAASRPDYTRRIVELLHDRLVRLADFGELARFFFVDDEGLVLDPALLVPKRLDRETAGALLAAAIDRLSRARAWVHRPGTGEGDPDDKPLEEALRALATERGVKPGDLFMVVRVAITGSTATPPLFETMVVLGRERVLARLERARDLLAS